MVLQIQSGGISSLQMSIFIYDFLAKNGNISIFTGAVTGAEVTSFIATTILVLTLFSHIVTYVDDPTENL